jgi:poly[(R)-3-hydroxyalkanoate] polymerase subunit PhaC
MMRAHKSHDALASYWQRAWLPAADAADRVTALAARAGLAWWAQCARAATGAPPLALPTGPATPHRVAADWPLARLLHYQARAPRRARPILIVASLINRYYVLDLLPELSVIASLAAAGFDVYVLDWKAPGAAGPALRFADYVDGALLDAARLVARDAARSDGGDARASLVIGYCMGGTLATLFAARHPAHVGALMLLGTPIRFRASGELARLTERGRFDADLLMDALGNMPPALMQSGFKLLNPADAAFKLAHLWLDAPDDARVRHRVAVEAWLEDNVAFPGGVYREYIRALYQDDALAAGRFRVAGERVDLARVTAPLANVVALRDRICAPASSRALMELVGTPPEARTLVEFDTGHIGLTTSRRAHAELWPRLTRWLEAHA